LLKISREEPSNMQITTIGFDLTKNILQLHAIDAAGSVVLRKRLRRAQVLPFSDLRAASLGSRPAAAPTSRRGRQSRSATMSGSFRRLM
jgi:hypothetical protein